MKKGKFNPTETACVKGMLAAGIPASQMGKQLERTPTAIQKEIDRVTEEAIKDQMFIKKTAKGEGGIVVMTQAASSQVDEAREAPQPKEKTRRSQWVHKIYEDK